MIISNAIVHSLKKEVGGQASLVTRGTELALSDTVNRLGQDVLRIYTEKANKGFGKFQDDVMNYPLSQKLLEHLDGGSDFVEFSKIAMSRLLNKIESVNFATGGYILFIRYHDKGADHLMVVMLRDTLGAVISDALEVSDTSHLDLGKLHLAAKIDLTGWRGGASDKYISFAKGRKTAERIAGYFTDFIGCDMHVNSFNETDRLVHAVNLYCLARGMSDEQKTRLREKAYAYCHEKALDDEPIYLESFSQFLNEEQPEDFFQYANNQHQISDGFVPVKAVFRKLRRYSGRSGSLSISFEEELLNSRKVIYNKAEKTLTIREIPEQLKAQLDER